MYSSGITVLDAIRSSEEIVGNRPLEQALRTAGQQIAEGTGRWPRAEQRGAFSEARGIVLELVPLLELARRASLLPVEMHESLKIVKQCLDRMPEGPIRTPVPRYPHFRVDPGEIFFHTENPRGDYALYMISKGGTEPYRMRLRSPCLCNLMALKPMLRDSYLADAVVILGSLDIILGEVDR